MKNQKPLKRKRGAAVDSTALLCLLADMRAAVGDPSANLMQDELVEHCRRMRTSLETISTYYRGDERSTESALEMRRIAKRALWPNNGTQRHGSPDGSLATETRKPGSLK